MFNGTNKLLAIALVGLGLSNQVMAQVSSLILEETIVTAQKRTESLADTPLTVNVMTGDQIGELGSFGFSDLANMTAGLSIGGNSFSADIATRGLGTDLNAATSPRVSTYFDGTFVANARLLFSGMFDLQQVELLRGPQGTLYGRSSPAGAITMRSSNPNLQHTDGYFRQSFTDRSGSNTQLGVSIPLIDNKLGLRIAGLYDTNEQADVENITLNRNLESDTTGLRAVIYWAPTDRFDLRVSYNDIEDKVDLFTVVEGNGIQGKDRIAVADFKSDYTSDSKVWIAEANYTFSNDWVATAVYSHQENNVRERFDGDGSEVSSRSQDVYAPSDDEIYEIRLASQENEFWNWNVGIYGHESSSVTTVDAETFVVDSEAPFPLRAETTGPADLHAEFKAYFIHNVFNFSDTDIVTLGVRYNDVERRARQPFVTDVYLLVPGTEGVLVDEIRFDGILPDDQEQSFDAFTGTLKYQRYFAEDVMGYASYDIGWRDGSTTIASGPIPPEFGGFDSEDSTNFELGVKWGFWEGRGLLNVALYYQIYENFHFEARGVEHNTPLGVVSQSNAVVNVPEVEVYGFDSDISVLISQHWNLTAALSYNSTEFTEASDVPCTTGEPLPPGDWSFNTCDLEGERAGGLPQWSFNFITEYWGDFSRLDSEWYVRGLLNSETEYYSTSFQEDLDGYTTLDLFMGLRAANGSWDVSLWVKNLTDETALLNTERLPQVPDYDTNEMVESGYIQVSDLLDSRTIGVTFNYNWGL